MLIRPQAHRYTRSVTASVGFHTDSLLGTRAFHHELPATIVPGMEARIKCWRSFLSIPSSSIVTGQAPLLKERETFLSHLHKQGTSRKALRNLSSQLLHVVHLLELNELRQVTLEEIQQPAQRWVTRQRSNPKVRSYRRTASFFNICGEEMASLPRSTQTAERTAHPVR